MSSFPGTRDTVEVVITQVGESTIESADDLVSALEKEDLKKGVPMSEVELTPEQLVGKRIWEMIEETDREGPRWRWRTRGNEHWLEEIPPEERKVLAVERRKALGIALS
jgi:hypothetical protein